MDAEQVARANASTDRRESRRRVIQALLGALTTLGIVHGASAGRHAGKKRRLKKRRRRQSGCQRGQTACRLGTKRSICVDLQSHAAHCGACGNACPTDTMCTGGVCVPAPCSGTQKRCSGICTDTNANPAHCGTCGNSCDIGEVCEDGACVSAYRFDRKFGSQGTGAGQVMSPRGLALDNDGNDLVADET